VDKVLEIALDYLANDQEVQNAVIYLQSSEFQKILTTVENLKEFKDVSTFICIFLNPQSDRENVSSVLTGG
jgi:formate hydrogenlyase subunit 4